MKVNLKSPTKNIVFAFSRYSCKLCNQMEFSVTDWP